MQRVSPFLLITFIAPALIIYVGIMVLPIASSLVLAFFQQQKDGSQVFVGLANLSRLINDTTGAVIDDRFWNALGNTTKFFLMFFFIQIPIALALGAILSIKGLRGTAFFRTVFFIPSTMSLVVTGWAWLIMLNPTWGIADTIVEGLGLGWAIPDGGWLGNRATALPTVALVGVWQFVGLPMILFLAAFLGVNEDLIEASRIDGASPWQIFWLIRLPLVLPTVGLVSILTFAGTFVSFDLPFVMASVSGDPDFSTDLLGTLFYRLTFGAQFYLPDVSMGITVATMTFLIEVAVITFYYTIIRKRLVRA